MWWIFYERTRIYLFWKVHFFKFCRKIPPQRRPRICRPVPAQPDRLLVRRSWHAIATRLPHPPRTRASSAQPCSTLPGCSTNPRFFGPSLNSMQKPPPATFCPPPVCAFCRTQPRLTACYFCTHPRPLCLWTSSASPCSTLSDRWTNTGVFGLFIDRMHKQPRATCCPPPICTFCRTRPRLTACCFCTCPAPDRCAGVLNSALHHLARPLYQPPVFRPFDRCHARITARHSLPPSRLRLLPYAAAAHGMISSHIFAPPRMRALAAPPCTPC